MHVSTGRRSGRNLTRGQLDAKAKEKEKAIQMAVAQTEKEKILAKKEAEAMEAHLQEAFVEGYRTAMQRAEDLGRVETGVLRDYMAVREYKRWRAPRRAVAVAAVARHNRWPSKLLKQKDTP